MGPAQAIKKGFAKSFQFKGRASRSEFWWFAPVAVGVVIPFVWLGLPSLVQMTWHSKLITAFFALWPLWSCGARRLQDTSENGADIFIPAGLLFGFPVAAALLVYATATLNGVAAILVFLFVALPLVGFGAFVAFISLGPTIGQLVVPSDLGENAYGPNPTEVPS